MGKKYEELLAAVTILIGLVVILSSAFYASWGTLLSGLIIAMLGVIYDRIRKIQPA